MPEQGPIEPEPFNVLRAFDQVSAEALNNLIDECEAAIVALEGVHEWPAAARLKEKLRWYQQVEKTAEAARTRQQ